MENLGDLVNASKSGFEKLLEKVPGLGGYEKKEDQRDTDRIVRETVASRFDEQWQRILTVQKDLAKGSGLIYVGDLENASLKIRQFIDRIKTAAGGYAGLMDAVKVDDSALQQLYDYDLYLFTLVDSVKEAVDKVESSVAANSGVDEAIKNLTSIAQQCLTALDRRSEVKNGTQSL